MLQLPDVTLVTVTSIDIDFTHAALIHCANCAKFGAVKMLSSSPPRKSNPGIEYLNIPKLDHLNAYSRFMLFSLKDYIETKYCLVIQMDGFILNPSLWTDEFYEYDYIGAPLPSTIPLFSMDAEKAGQVIDELKLDKNVVGNGGFSLRSRNLLEATSRLPLPEIATWSTRSEDLIICYYSYERLTSAGIRFAPPEVAARFSIESPDQLYGQTIDTTFGFHGKHWFAPELDAKPLPFLRAVLRSGVT
jgi:hypothetical protein